MRSYFVGRIPEQQRIKATLENQEMSGLNILSIEGSGGIGKSRIFEYVLKQSNIEKQNYLILTLRAKEQQYSLDHLINNIITSAKNNQTEKKPTGYYFSNTCKVITEIEKMKYQVSKKSDGEYDPLFENIISLGASFINDKIPHSKHLIDYENKEDIKYALSTIKNAVPIWEKLGLGKNIAFKNSIIEDAPKVISDALIQDLTAILSGYKAKNIFKPSHKKLKGADKLLLVIDDYEKTKDCMAPFLLSHFLNRLADADFPSLVIILGRDQLAQDTDWEQHFEQYLLKPIKLEHLSKVEVNMLLDRYNIAEQEERQHVWNDTEGYPLLVQLWIKEIENGGNTIGNLKQFYERTTKWMTQEHKNWLKHLIFLDTINKPNLRILFESKNEEEIDDIFTWFTNEPSICGRDDKSYSVRKFIRSRLLKYTQIIDFTEYENLKKQADTIKAINNN